MIVKVLDRTILKEKGSNPAMVEIRIKQDILRRISLLAEKLDVNLVENIFVISNNSNKKTIAQVKPYLSNNEPFLNIYIQHVAIACWLNGINSAEFEEIIYHELCHCDDIARIVKGSGIRYFIQADSIIQSVKQLYEHMGILMWGEYIAYCQTYKQFSDRHNSFESKFSNAIKKAGISMEFIKTNPNENADLLYDSTKETMQSLFYGITRNIALMSTLNNEKLDQKNDELLIAGESRVNGLKSLSYKVRELLSHMQSVAYQDDFFSCFCELGEMFYALYRDNGMVPIDKNGMLEFIHP